MKIYKGKRMGPRQGMPNVEVTVNGKSLKHQVRHSPTGFEWGYLGSGPADLARSILWDFLGKEPHQELYMAFKGRFVAEMGNEWEITSEDIRIWIIDRYGESYFNYLTGISDPRD